MQALRDVTARSIERAQRAPMPLSASNARTLNRNVDRVRDRVAEYYAAHHEAGTTNRLTAEAIAADRAKLKESFEQEASGLISESKGVVDAYREQLESAMTTPSKPSEERLGNARTDAKLALDGAQAENLLGSIKELATEGEPVMAYLLLFTPWVSYYARNRRALGLTDRWEHATRQLMVEWFTEDGMRAHQSLNVLKELTEVPTHMRQMVRWHTPKGLTAASPTEARS